MYKIILSYFLLEQTKTESYKHPKLMLRTYNESWKVKDWYNTNKKEKK
jgi:hypothetical protein